MSKFKVGDRVRVRIPGEVFDGSVCITPKQGDIAYYVRDSDGNEFACMPDGISRLVKRKRAKSPDRVMVAAQLMAFVSRWNTPLDREQDDEYAARIRSIALKQADALIAEGKK